MLHMTFYNSGYSEILHDFDVALMYNKTATQTDTPLNTSNFNLCHHFDGPAGLVENITCNGTVEGQYLTFYINHNRREVLTLCEVNVYEQGKVVTQTICVVFIFNGLI